MDIIVEGEFLTNQLSDFGVHTWRSPMTCGRGTTVLDCLFALFVRVLFVNTKALSSNRRFFRASHVKDEAIIAISPW
jgi:hypothetical protein